MDNEGSRRPKKLLLATSSMVTMRNLRHMATVYWCHTAPCGDSSRYSACSRWAVDGTCHCPNILPSSVTSLRMFTISKIQQEPNLERELKRSKGSPKFRKGYMLTCLAGDGISVVFTNIR